MLRSSKAITERKSRAQTNSVFPKAGAPNSDSENGAEPWLSLRDYFAVKAMQAMILKIDDHPARAMHDNLA